MAGFYLGALGNAQARPVHKQALADYFGPLLAARLNDCRTCHLPDPPGRSHDSLATEKPHNAFGARLAALKKDLRKEGKKIDIATRLEAVALEDADGDGVSNLVEILTGHFPGDASDKPTSPETADYTRIHKAFLKFRLDNSWNPFAQIDRPTVPLVRNSPWVRNPIDAFISREHEEHGLQPRPEAHPAILLRRVFVDLIGLPPTPDELHAFMQDTSPDRYEKVVERLLASPHYGERWGRHWMDVWRYSDWAGWGAQVRDSQPHVWRWRDWIIESLNQDKGLDRMIVEMLAGDELAPDDPDTLRATGYLVRNFKLLSRETWMQETVDHTAQAFLGVTLGCARCHDHMFDPILQKEYYQVRAIFEPHQVRLDRVPGQPDSAKDGLARVYDGPPAQTFVYQRGDERTPEKNPISPGVPEILGGKFPDIQPVPLPLTAACPDQREFVRKETVRASFNAQVKAQLQWKVSRQECLVQVSALVGLPGIGVLGRSPAYESVWQKFHVAALDADLADNKHAWLLSILKVEEMEASGRKGWEWERAATETVRLERLAGASSARRNLEVARQEQSKAKGAAKDAAAAKVSAAEKSLTKAEADYQAPLNSKYTPRALPRYPATSTGRRLAFARWIASRDNPLTARVAVNHMWLRHFGQALVPSVFDFGKNGRKPSHPALLDWLAAEFMNSHPSPSRQPHEGEWTMKSLHRLIVTSNAYRQASTPDAANSVLDRDNRWYWRMKPRQAEAEVVRDSLYFVAGRLDSTFYGPDLDHQQGLTIPRRSIYFRHASEKQMEFLKIFDCAAVGECYQRKESITPQQALALANSPISRNLAQSLAKELNDEKNELNSEAFVTRAFERILSRPPTPEELTECLAFLANHQGKDFHLPVKANLIHVLMNHHEFVSIR